MDALSSTIKNSQDLYYRTIASIEQEESRARTQLVTGVEQIHWKMNKETDQLSDRRIENLLAATDPNNPKPKEEKEGLYENSRMLGELTRENIMTRTQQSQVIIKDYSKILTILYEARENVFKNFSQEMDKYRESNESQLSKLIELKKQEETLKLEKLTQVVKFYQLISQDVQQGIKQRDDHEAVMTRIKLQKTELVGKIKLEEQQAKFTHDLETLRIEAEERGRIWKTMISVLKKLLPPKLSLLSIEK